MRSSLLLLAAALLTPLLASAQTSRFGFEPKPELARVVVGADTLRNGFAGGFNAPMFSQLDLNQDGQPDLFVFDRMTNRSFTFLNAATPAGGRQWKYAPDYEALFPSDLVGWVLLRDYDCDGRPDLFTRVNSNEIRVFRNAPGAGGLPNFVLVSNSLLFTDAAGNNGRVQPDTYDVPAIEDVNGDGLLDMLFRGSGNRVFHLYLNSGPGCGTLHYNLVDYYWGSIQICNSTCNSYAVDSNRCRPAPPYFPVTARPDAPAARPTHTGGYTVLLQDIDNDNDLDLLVGSDNCAEYVAIRNTGTRQQAQTNAGSLLSTIPNGVGTVSLPNFPAGYLVDLTLNGRPDLVLGAALVDNSDLLSLRDVTRVYENSGTAAQPSYALNPDASLQAQMVDVSEGAAPAFADLNGDGLVDMLVANYADQYGNAGAQPSYYSSLRYYQNVGTAAKPAFKLITDDYLGLTARHYIYIRPLLVDLDRDGKVDLVYTAEYGGGTHIYYHLNTAAAGQPASFDVSQFSYIDLNYNWSGIDDAACFADVNNDGYLDLVLGTRDFNPVNGKNGRLRYYQRDPGQPLNTGFVITDADLGGIRDSNTPSGYPERLAPLVADVDGDGTLDLMTVDYFGRVRLYTDFRSQTAPFLERTDFQFSSVTQQYGDMRLGSGRYSFLTFADLNGDRVPELITGTPTGGIQVFGTRNRTVLAARPAAATALPLQLYPNPATTTVTVVTEVPTTLAVLDLAGRVVRTAAAAQRHQLALEQLPAGVYLVRATSPADGRNTVQRLVVGQTH